MQYEITLPADYDMNIIRRRVETRGRAMDAFPGLGFKAYCVRERGVDGSSVNQYAPFYVWTSGEGRRRFLFGEGFRALSESFGRPPVQDWTGVEVAPGPARAAPPVAATRSHVPLAVDAGLAETLERAREDLARLARTPGLHSATLAVDTRRWAVLHFALWADAAATGDGVRYRVLHLSAPGGGLA